MCSGRGFGGGAVVGQSDRGFSFGVERLIVRFYGFRNGKLNNLIGTKGNGNLFEI